ncbi:DUF6225 family protein [Actinacidiphila soli]|jgi:hypothetical protein|uniref:DUF6225 family protein n=1 Tax=Actinacidiphila soli TaxID=2487275 RepID=UPI000FCC3994|nr:DUF6225 family protein [Actinacidiphila soli]
MTETVQTQSYTHTVQIWTVGRLREALATYPDNMPLHIAMPDDPAPHTAQTVDDRYVVTGIGIGTSEHADAGLVDADYVTIEADFPSGEYEQHP